MLEKDTGVATRRDLGWAGTLYALLQREPNETIAAYTVIVGWARRGTWAVSSANVRRVHRFSWHRSLRLVQITSAGSPTGMSSRRRGRRECTRVMPTPP